MLAKTFWSMMGADKERRVGGFAIVWLLAAVLSTTAAAIAVGDESPTPPAGAAAVPPAPEKPIAAPAAPAAPVAPAVPAAPGTAPAPGAAVPATPAPAAATAAASATAAPAAAPSADANKPNFLQELGRWWQQSIDDFNSRMKDAQKKLDDYNKKQSDAAKDAAAATQEAMKNAAIAIVRLPNTRVIEVHEQCATAANGAPDCQTAATNACRSKGFNTGQPLDVNSSEKCATTMWLTAQSQNQDPCRVEIETVVTRAVCQ